jgi:hypothetical protein
MAKTIGQLTQATTLASGDEFVIEQSGLTKRVAASVVRGGLVNADIDAAAAIAHTKLANITAGRVLLGNASNVPTATELTGDVTVSNTGVTTLARPLTLATAQNTTSGTSIDFTGIPSWVKRITVMFDGVSTNGTSPISLQLGDSGGVETAGYSGFGTMIAGSGTAANIVASTANTVGFNLSSVSSADDSTIGIATILNFNGNTWVFASNVQRQTSATSVGNGSKTLSATLDRIRLTTVNGTDTFDAGSVNIMYEG